MSRRERGIRLTHGVARTERPKQGRTTVRQFGLIDMGLAFREERTCSFTWYIPVPVRVIRSRLMGTALHAPATRVRVEQSPPLSWFVRRAGP